MVHVATVHSFLLPINIPQYKYATVCHLLMDNLGGFQFGAIPNQAAVHLGVLGC